MSAADANTLSVAAFAALGTIVGYLGAEVASSSMFDRILWPSRFFNDRSPKSFAAYVFLMPIGGPIHKAAVMAVDRLVAARIFQGYCCGDMLGTAFLEDKKQSYVVRTAQGGRGPRKEARNAFWVTALSLVPLQPQFNGPMPHDDEAAAKHVEKLRSQHPVHLLRLSTVESIPSDVPIVSGDIGPMKARYIGAVLCSELITLAVGVVNAVVWKSPYCLWYFTPLLLKMAALLCSVRREGITSLSLKPEDDKDDKPILCEVEGYSRGFLLIQGQPELLLPFFRHYGHPIRHRRGILSDRFREVMSALSVVAAIIIYPSGLILFIFAPVATQWVWLGYQLFAIIAMHVYRFVDGEHLGTTQEWIGRELYRTGKVLLDYGNGNKVLACLETDIASSVADGRQKVESLVERELLKHAALST